MASATLRPAAPVWRAGADGEGHAIVSRGDKRYACGEPVLDERFAHPVATRCLRCLERAGVDVSVRVAPPSLDEQTYVDWAEPEFREAWGR